MPYFPQSPETAPTRSDSKNPSCTCRGITGNGRPCRRPLATSANRTHIDGNSYQVKAVEMHVAAWYCWQHKDQAGNVPVQSSTTPVPRQPSLETLVQRLDLSDVKGSVPGARTNKYDIPIRHQRGEQPTNHHKSNNSGYLPQQRREQASSTQPRLAHPSTRTKQSPGFWQGLFCFAQPDQHDYIELVRHRKRMHRPKSPSSASREHWKAPKDDSKTGEASPATSKAKQQLSPRIAEALGVIPPSLSTETTSRLLQEILKPIAEADEHGYIYIFWLTEERNAAPPQSLTTSLLKPESQSRPSDHRRASDAIRGYAESGEEKAKTMLLKIGRSNNVHRRMNEWNRQCGYNLSLIRYYPHVSSAEASSGSPRISPHTDGTVPHVHRVERLIHLELAEKRVRQPTCITCQQAHREWFEIDASRKGLGAVDEVIKRWINWAEQRASRPF